MREVLSEVVAPAGGATWLTVAAQLPLLAEAAPDVFLAVLEDDLGTSDPSVGELFQVANGEVILAPFGSHHPLLWALEVLCWSPDHLVRATQNLSKLARFELPPNAGNTPMSSLATVLCGWVRHTSADLTMRLQALDACRGISPSVGWTLLERLWPDQETWVTPPAQPRFRTWEPSSTRMPTSEWVAFIQRLVDRAIAWAREDGDHLPWLLKATTSVGRDDADRIFEFLESQVGSGDLEDEARFALFECATRVAAQHSRFPDADWAISPEQVARVTRLAESLQPAVDSVLGYAILFTRGASRLASEHSDYEQQYQELDAKRRAAIGDILTRADGWQLLAELAEKVEVPSAVGWSLSDCEGIDSLPIMVAWLGSEKPARREAAATWTRRSLQAIGPTAIERVLSLCGDDTNRLAQFVLNLPTESQYWDVLWAHPEAAEIFWKQANFEIVPPQDVDVAVAALLERERPWSCVSLLGGRVYLAKEVPDELPSSALVLQVLRATLNHPLDEGDIEGLSGHLVGELLDYLEETGSHATELAGLEYGFFRLLGHTRKPRALYEALDSDSSLFVDLVEQAFPEESKPPNRGDVQAAQHAWAVLDAWNGYPGRTKNGALDAARMREWVDQARLRLSGTNRANICDELIGKTFTHMPEDAGDVWPPAPVRNLIEGLGSVSLENGTFIGRVNSRGVTTRGAFEGGAQERVLAAEYGQASQLLQAKWPRTARVLREIESWYQRDAAYHDRSAQLRQDLD